MHTMRTHQQIDQRSLALHQLVAEKIRRDPALFARAHATLARWRQTACERTWPHLDEWAALMKQGMPACLAVATADTEHANDLRQSSPFAGLLTNAERFQFLREWNSAHASQ